MNGLDYTIIGIVILSAVISLVRGFVREALSLVSWVCAFFVASHYYHYLTPYFTRIDNDYLRSGVAIALLFIVTLIIGGLVNHLIGTLVDKTGLTGTDRLLGIFFGVLRGILIVAALLFFLDTFTAMSSSQMWRASLLVPQFDGLIQWMFHYIQNNSSFLPHTNPF